MSIASLAIGEGATASLAPAPSTNTRTPPRRTSVSRPDRVQAPEPR